MRLEVMDLYPEADRAIVRHGAVAGPSTDELITRAILEDLEGPTRRVDWLCSCGNGRLAVPEEDVPDYCPLCGYPIGARDRYQDWEL